MFGTHTLLCCQSESHGLLFHEVQAFSLEEWKIQLWKAEIIPQLHEKVLERIQSHRTPKTPQRDISNFVQMTKPTTFRNTAVNHTDLIYTHSSQTAFGHTALFLHSLPCGTQRLAPAFPYAGSSARPRGRQRSGQGSDEGWTQHCKNVYS